MYAPLSLSLSLSLALPFCARADPVALLPFRTQGQARARRMPPVARGCQPNPRAPRHVSTTTEHPVLPTPRAHLPAQQKGRRVCQGVRYAIRDAQWGTAPGKMLAPPQISEHDGGFSVAYEVRPPLALAAAGTLLASAQPQPQPRWPALARWRRAHRPRLKSRRRWRALAAPVRPLARAVKISATRRAAPPR